MDQTSFDRLARLLGGGATRRQGLAAALAGALGLAGSVPAGVAVAVATVAAAPEEEGNPGDEAKCLKGKAAKKKRCRKHAQCCTGYCKKIRKRKNGKVRKTRRCRCAPEGFKCGAKTKCCGAMTCATGTCAPPTPTPPPGPTGGGCSPATCATGCCKDGVCQPGTDAGACGAAGAACAACGGATPVCKAGVCSAKEWREVASYGGTCDGNPPIPNDQSQELYDVHLANNELEMYLSDVFNTRVTYWTRPDTASAFTAQTPIGGTWGTGDADMKNCYRLTLSPDELEMYLTGERRIKRWTRGSIGGAWTAQAEVVDSYGPGNGQLKGGWGITISPDALELYITDLDNTGYIKVWTRTSTATAWTAQPQLGNGQGSNNDQLNYGRGITISSDGLELFIADADNNRIAYWKRATTGSAWAAQAPIGSGASGTANGDLNGPHGLALSTDDLTMFIADSYNHRITHWTRSSKSAAWEAQAPFGSKPALDTPGAVAISPDNKRVYVTDESSCRVSVWSQE